MCAYKYTNRFTFYILFDQDNADPVLLGDHDVALASIDKVVAGKILLGLLDHLEQFLAACCSIPVTV